jgi:hypothetical protein
MKIEPTVAPVVADAPAEMPSLIEPTSAPFKKTKPADATLPTPVVAAPPAEAPTLRTLDFGADETLKLTVPMPPEPESNGAPASNPDATIRLTPPPEETK